MMNKPKEDSPFKVRIENEEVIFYEKIHTNCKFPKCIQPELCSKIPQCNWNLTND